MTKRGIGHWHLSDLVAFVFLALLASTSYYVSSLTLAGIPVALVVLVLLLVSHKSALVHSLRNSRGLRVLTILWLVWVGVTLVRLVVDFPKTGTLALRDAMITLFFAAVLLGAAIVTRWGVPALLAAGRVVSGFLVVYFLLTLLRPFMPQAIADVLNTQNAGVAGVALVAAGLWSTGNRYRMVCVATGSAAVLVAQSRMLTLIVAILLVLYLLLPQKGKQRSLATRILVLAGIIAAVVVLADLLSRVPLVAGRFGGVSLETLWELAASVFDDESALAGTRQDREDWWAGISNQIIATPDAFITGLGLGTDLLNGFQTGNGILVRKPHNDYFEAFARTGLFGAIPIVLIVITGLVATLRLLMRDGEWGFLFGWLVAAAAMATAQPYFSYAHGAVLAGVVIGAAVVTRSSQKTGTELGIRRHHPAAVDR